LALGGVVAWSEGGWSWIRWAAIFFASFFVHLCTNLANDYFDHAAGVDSGDSIGGSRVIQEGKITPDQIRSALILLYSLALILGLWVVWTSQVWELLLVMPFSFFSSLFYTAPPIRYGYLGLGELFVGINMGPAMVAGTAAALVGGFSARAFWLSAPIGFMVALILYYQSLPDIDTDRASGKRTIAVRLGKPAAIWGFRILAACSLISIILLVAGGVLHPWGLAALVTLAPAWQIDRMIRDAQDWKDLHGRGGRVRLFYLINGLILILAAGFSV
jgi:1,4-dihydroxy-2-naphthoate octaprenyltransferase